MSTKSIDATIRGVGLFICWKDAHQGDKFTWWLMGRSSADDRLVSRIADTLTPEEIKDAERLVIARRKETRTA